MVCAHKKIKLELINIANILIDQYAYEVYLVLFLILYSPQIVFELVRMAASPKRKGNEKLGCLGEWFCILDFDEL